MVGVCFVNERKVKREKGMIRKNRKKNQRRVKDIEMSIFWTTIEYVLEEFIKVLKGRKMRLS